MTFYAYSKQTYNAPYIDNKPPFMLEHCHIICLGHLKYILNVRVYNQWILTLFPFRLGPCWMQASSYILHLLVMQDIMPFVNLYACYCTAGSTKCQYNITSTNPFKIECWISQSCFIPHLFQLKEMLTMLWLECLPPKTEIGCSILGKITFCL